MIHTPSQPIHSEKLDRMLRPYCAVPAAQIVRRTILVASPADALRIFRIERDFRLRHECFSPAGTIEDGGLLTNVANRFSAKMLTAVISMIAETGSHDHADRRKF